MSTELSVRWENERYYGFARKRENVSQNREQVGLQSANNSPIDKASWGINQVPALRRVHGAGR